MIAIIDYKAGNLTSVRLAFEALGCPCQITRDANEIRRADRVVFPGDGAARSAMVHLDELNLLPAIRQVVQDAVPFLGICLGTQIILERSEENDGTDTIGLIPGQVKRFRPSDPRIKIPHIGWNAVEFQRSHPLLAGIDNGSEFYFIHSYYPAPNVATDIVGITEYADVRFAAIMGRANICAAQFHPERSGRIGLKLLENFAHWNGTC